MSTSEKKPVLAIFDFDGTLTRSDSFSSFLLFHLGWAPFTFHLGMLLPSLVLFKLGRINNHTIKEKVLCRTIGGIRESVLTESAKTFADDRLDALLRPEALTRLAWHREQGHSLWLCSASPAVYLKPWTERHGFDGICATRLESDNGRVTGRIEGLNCWGPEKVRRLMEVLPDLTQHEVFVYGDSRGDREMLELADIRWYRGKQIN